MEAWKGARFVGLYMCFPTEKNNRRTEILRKILELEQILDFNEMKFGLLMGKIRETKFNESRLPEVFRSLEIGNADWLQLHFTRPDKEWTRSYEDHVELAWESMVAQPLQRPLSPVEERFGRNVGSIIVTYPSSRFEVNSESSFQKRLLQLVRLLTLEHGAYYAFVHAGFRPKRPARIGADDVFQETREKFPLTSFDADLHTAIFYKEFVKGAFWANFLNPLHVARLGGVKKIQVEHPPSVFTQIQDDRALLQVGSSPFPRNYDKVVDDYQRLRRFLRPILLETPEEIQKLQMDLIGSWRPPGYDANWKKLTCL